MWVDSEFDGGNIETVAVNDTGIFDLKIRPDRQTGNSQWFYFRVLGARGNNCKFNILNAGQASYPEAWPDGSVVASYDRKHWFRRPTSFDGNVLRFNLECDAQVLYIALSPPYSQEQHQDLICWALASSGCELHDTIRTVEGRPIEILRVGFASLEAPKVWIIARQHPGEPMASWYMEGLIRRLLDPADKLASKLRARVGFYLVPNMNPDGCISGNLRTNAIGVDLNRAWAAPNRETSPEVFGVLNRILESGVDLFLDIHGDEEFRFVFAAGCEGNPSISPRLAKADAQFRSNYAAANPDFSTKNGYPPDDPGVADLSIACNHIGERFGCLALTIEMPFKDNKERLDPIHGWGTKHSRELGAAALDAIAGHFADTL